MDSLWGRRVSTGHSGLLPEIQALRAVAVALVVVFHLWPSALPGGYVGVDAFFVISGFLITAHLWREADRSGTLELRRFWARRVRRLFPASLLVLAVSGLGVRAFVPSTSWEQFAREIGAATIYTLNFYLAASAVDYQAQDNLRSPVQHYWSLSVEEQFYLAWPLLLLGALHLARRLHWASPRRSALVALSLVTLGSLAYSVSLTRSSPELAYFVTPTRAWEFGAGALLALLPAERNRPALWATISWLGLLALGLSAALFSASTEFPGYAALVPVLGTLALLAAGSPACAWAATRWAPSKPLQFLGDISYSLYLWHWPLLILTPYALGQSPFVGWKWGVLVATLAFATATKILVEDPVRHGALDRRSPWLSLGLGASAMVLVLGGAGWLLSDLESRPVPKNQDRIARLLRQGQTVPCFGAIGDQRAGESACQDADLNGVLLPPPNKAKRDRAWTTCMVEETDSTVNFCETGVGAAEAQETIALVGDSHAEHWLPTLDSLARRKKWRILRALKSKCPLNEARGDLTKAARDSCVAWNRGVHEELRRRPEISALFVAGSSFNRFQAKAPESWREMAAQGYLDAWRSLPTSIRQIYVLRDTPRPRADVVQCLELLGSNAARLRQGACARDATAALLPDPAVQAAAFLPERVRVLDLSRRFCDEKRCSPVVGHALVYRDKSHMTATFARTLAPFLDELMSARP